MQIKEFLDKSKIKTMPNGHTVYDGYLDLRNTAITSLEGLPQKINGSLYLNHTAITSLAGLPQKINGSLDLRHTAITSLEGLPKEINGSLYLSHTAITSLVGLPQKINGYLYLRHTAIVSEQGLSVVSDEIGSRKSITYYIIPHNLIYCGCWKGTLAGFEARVKKVYPADNKHYQEYIEFIQKCKESK